MSSVALVLSMSASIAFQGVFLWLSAAAAVAVLMGAHRAFWALWDAITNPPPADVVGPCDEFERTRVFREER